MTQLLVANVTAKPYNDIVYVQSTFADGAMFAGSGVLVGPNDVLTAGHLVYDQRHGGAAINVSVTAAYDPGAQSQPFGTQTTNSFHYFPLFDPDGDGIMFSGNIGAGLGGSEADIALLDLSTPIGNSTGWMAMDPAFSSGTVNLSGFPSASGFSLTNSIGTVQRSFVDSTLFYTDGLRSMPGNSGGPLWYQDAAGGHVVGISSTSLWAADIDGVYSTLQSWISGNDYLFG